MADDEAPRTDAAPDASEGTVFRGVLLRRPKAGHRPDEYEDAAACTEAAAYPFRAAVADGATESAFARLWAERLVDRYVEAGGWTPLAPLQQAWQDEVAPRAASLPWYAAAKAEQGAYAAALGCTWHPGGRWTARAVGDCCLFHLRGGREQLRWPVEAPEAFDHHPALLPSRPHVLVPPTREREGGWQAGDAFVLATDALAAWLMRVGPERALTLDPAGFRSAVAAARADGTLRNDDVTLAVVTIGI